MTILNCDDVIFE